VTKFTYVKYTGQYGKEEFGRIKGEFNPDHKFQSYSVFNTITRSKMEVPALHIKVLTLKESTEIQKQEKSKLDERQKERQKGHSEIVSEYWVGNIGRALFVFDKTIQSSDAASVTLFSYSLDEPVKLDKIIVKARIEEAKGPEIEDPLKRFKNWKKFHSSSLKTINNQPGPPTLKLIQTLQGGLIKAYWGRKAHCYNCCKSLTGTRGNLCHDCFWITCSCGACGCGFSRGY